MKYHLAGRFVQIAVAGALVSFFGACGRQGAARDTSTVIPPASVTATTGARVDRPVEHSSSAVRRACWRASRKFSGFVYCPSVQPRGSTRVELVATWTPKRRKWPSYVISFLTPDLGDETAGGHWVLAGGHDAQTRWQWLGAPQQRHVLGTPVRLRGATVTYYTSLPEEYPMFGGHDAAVWKWGSDWYAVSVHGTGHRAIVLALAQAIVQAQQVQPTGGKPGCVGC